MVKLILKKSGKQVANMVDGSGKNVFHYAAEAKEPDVLNYLIPESKSGEKTVDTEDESGENVSHYASEEKEPDDHNLHLMVKTMIAYTTIVNLIFSSLFILSSFMQVVFQ